MANNKSIVAKAFKFQPFSKKQLELLSWWTKDSPYKDKFICVADGSVRSGKSQTVSAHLYCPDGKKKMGEIRVGDYVFNKKGKPVRVLGIFPQGKLDTYRITFHDGSSTVCSKEHLWSYTTQKCVSNKHYTMYTSTLEDIMADLESYKDKDTMYKRAGKYRFPLNDCVEFEKQEVKIDPYLLGLLLGDGCITGNSSFSFTNDEYELHEYVKKAVSYYDCKYTYYDRDESHCARGNIIHNNILKKFLRYYGLYGKRSETKFIPSDYRYNVKEIRLQILAGLLNTDGYAQKGKSSIRYTTVSKQLYNDVAEVARSLGLFVNTDKKLDTREKNKHICYELTIRVNNELYDLLSSKHKSRLNLDVKKQKNWRLIKSIEYVGKEECQCIYVDDDEHLYLTDDFIVTHNTIVAITSFVLFLMSNFNYQNASISGKTVMTARRNLVNPLKQICLTLGIEVIDHRSENFLELRQGKTCNLVYIFGGKDERAQDMVQGLTLACSLIDEVVLMPESFYNQLVARHSVDGAKIFTTSNPGSPWSWFYKDVIKRLPKINGIYLHFTMDDNPSLSEEVKERYKQLYSGVWKRRFIDGKWCVADGLIYDMLSPVNIKHPDDIPYDKAEKWYIGVDYGTANATAFELGFKDIDGNIYICKEYYFAGRLEAQEQGDYDSQKTDIEYTNDMRQFISDNEYLTDGLTYREIPIIVDPAANSFKLQLRRYHMKTKNANNDVLDGIRTVATLFSQGKLYISKECTNLIQELHTYSWDSKKQQLGIDSPCKVNDHACDALRYLVMETQRVRSMENVTRRIGL